MQEIGYVFKYSDSEQKGILVYGHWRQHLYSPSHISHISLANMPIIFYLKDCVDVVKTGDLISFSFNDGIASDIKRLSLRNFDKSCVAKCISTKTIKYERIYDETSDHVKDEILTVLGKFMPENNGKILDGLRKEIEFYDLTKNKFVSSNNQLFDYSFPATIDEIFECFGKYGHEKRFNRTLGERKVKQTRHEVNDTIEVNLLDMALWMDEDILNGEYFGQTPEEIMYLYNLFINKTSNPIESPKEKRQSNCISSSWSILLSKLSDSNLNSIINKCPILQPAFPIDFCQRNIEVLNENYGFPTIKIAELFLGHLVKNVTSATQYRHVNQLIHVIHNCGVVHLPGEGVPFCSIDKTKLKNISISLERKKQNVLSFVKEQIKICSRDTELLNIANYIDLHDVKFMLRVGEFLDLITEISNEPNQIYFRKEKIVKEYNNLPTETHVLLDSYLRNEFNKILLEALKCGEFSPFSLHNTIETLSKWIDESFLKTNANGIRTVFLKTADMEVLKSAFEYGYISNDDYASNIKKYIDELTIWQLAKFTTEPYDKMCFTRLYETPVKTQKYVLNRLVTLYNIKELDKGENIRISDFNSFYNLKSLIRWLTELKSGQYGHIDHKAIEFAINKAIEPLDSQDIQLLYRDKCMVKSGEKINTALNEYFHQLMKDMSYQEYRDNLYDDNFDNRYSDSWAQDVEWYSDDDIDTIFDGDPDAYWNID